MSAVIVRVNGALVEATPLGSVALHELAEVGEAGLIGEVIRLRGETATLQVYEDTNGLALGEPVRPLGRPLEAELGPGLLGAVLDGIGRPLDAIAASTGAFIAPGVRAPSLDRARAWTFAPAVSAGAVVSGGTVLGHVVERPGFSHAILVPPDTGGTLAAIRGGEVKVGETVATLEDGTPLGLFHRWPVRRPRPFAERLRVMRPFATGQRILDFLFPVAEGGSVAVPGGFGTGKTIVEQSIAKHGDADVVVFIGCGERGNEMAEVLEEFPALTDPRTGRSMMDRTVLIANTSNMPVAARVASIDLGLTIGEYFRDMGLRVAVMADSLSRWAEALREIGARLEELPGEEGYPTALASRLGRVFERAGAVRAAGTPERTGALTLIAAISPPGGDFSEPVTQAALRVVGGLWALDAKLAHQRQFPAVDWEQSHSLYVEGVSRWLAERVAPDWSELRRETLELLQKDSDLREIAALVGAEALQDRDRLVLAIARVARDQLLAQNAFDPADASSPFDKTWQLASLVSALSRAASAKLEGGTPLERIDLAAAERAIALVRGAPPPEVREKAARAREEIGRP